MIKILSWLLQRLFYLFKSILCRKNKAQFIRSSRKYKVFILIAENKNKISNIISFTEFNLTDINITHYQHYTLSTLHTINIEQGQRK